MDSDIDIWARTFTATSPSEIIDWADAFSEVTNLPPSESLSIYAELTLMEDVDMLFVAACSRHSTILMAEMFEDKGERHPEFGESADLIVKYTEYTDDVVAEIDDQYHSERFSHYENVLTHHNFSRLFIRLFLQSLSPTSECIPARFGIRAEDIFEGEFDSSPYLSDEDDDEDDEENPFAGAGDLFESMRLAKPVSPEGWLAVFNHLGVSVRINQQFRDQLQDPFFFAVDATHKIPVYLGGPAKTPYDDEDPAANRLKTTFEAAIRGKYNQAFLFYSCPAACGDLEASHVTYWGEAFVDGGWKAMVLTMNSKSIEDILSQAKLTFNPLKDLNNPKLTEATNELVHVWSKNHIDPMLEIFETKH